MPKGAAEVFWKYTWCATKTTIQKVDITEDDITMSMYEQYGTGTITKIPSIEEILNYDKDKKIYTRLKKNQSRKMVLPWK